LQEDLSAVIGAFRWTVIAFNYIAFYLLWFICIWADIKGYGLFVTPLVALYLYVHLAWISPDPRRELCFISLLAAMGACSDTLFAVTHLVYYQHTFLPGISWWNLSLWVCFGTTYWHAFSWLEPRPLLAAVLGAIVAPICYVGIEEAGAIFFTAQREIVLSIISFFWAVFLPVTFHISKKIRAEG
jgi:hypothetical protein